MVNRVTLALALAVIALVGCATTENYKKIVESWMGDDVNNLVRSWGAPTSTFQMPNGNTILVYERRGSFATPITVTPGQTTGYFVGNTYYSHTSPATVTGGQTIPLWCRTEFEAEPSGQLVRWSFEGNTCRARAPESGDSGYKDRPQGGPGEVEEGQGRGLKTRTSAGVAPSLPFSRAASPTFGRATTRRRRRGLGVRVEALTL